MPVRSETGDHTDAITASGDSLTEPDTTSPDVEAARDRNSGPARGDHDNAVAEGETTESPPSKRRLRLRRMPHRQALLVGLPLIAVLWSIAGWLGWQLYETHRVANEHAQLLQVGRQGALNLTTIDWQHADADVQRILNSATGTFYDDFSKRSQPFIDVVKQAQSKSEGTVTAAGLESASDDEGQVLVAVSVKITNAGKPEQRPRAWRMRVSVQKVGDDMKVSHVEFVA